MDINHTWGSDAVLGPSGDLSLVSGDNELKQRILRRLMTNDAVQSTQAGILQVVGDYLSHQDYGGSVPRRIGQLMSPGEIKSQITAQMMLEADVAKSPAPVVVVMRIKGGAHCRLEYYSAISQTKQVLELDI